MGLSQLQQKHPPRASHRFRLWLVPTPWVPEPCMEAITLPKQLTTGHRRMPFPNQADQSAQVLVIWNLFRFGGVWKKAQLHWWHGRKSHRGQDTSSLMRPACPGCSSTICSSHSFHASLIIRKIICCPAFKLARCSTGSGCQLLTGCMVLAALAMFIAMQFRNPGGIGWLYPAQSSPLAPRFRHWGDRCRLKHQILLQASHIQDGPACHYQPAVAIFAWLSTAVTNSMSDEGHTLAAMPFPGR